MDFQKAFGVSSLLHILSFTPLSNLPPHLALPLQFLLSLSLTPYSIIKVAYLSSRLVWPLGIPDREWFCAAKEHGWDQWGGLKEQWEKNVFEQNAVWTQRHWVS